MMPIARPRTPPPPAARSRSGEAPHRDQGVRSGSCRRDPASNGQGHRAARGAREAQAPETQAPVTARREVEPGDLVHVRDIPQLGEALSAVGEDGRVEVQFGSLRMKVYVDRIDRIETPTPTGERIKVPMGPPVSVELDLRGQRAEAALEQFESYLDNAFRAGLPFVRIIHGRAPARSGRRSARHWPTTPWFASTNQLQRTRAARA